MLEPLPQHFVLGIVGAGAMGSGIAQISAVAGIDVKLLDARPAAAEAACSHLTKTIGTLAAKGKLDAAQAANAIARIRPVAASADLADCAVVVEAIVEDLEAKRTLFTQLEAVVGADCILASNTSSLSISAIAGSCARPERVVGLHFFNPVPLMRIVEIIGGELTAESVVDRMTHLVKRLGHEAVRAADTPGFIVNHAGRAFGTEALQILQEGVASFADIDRILRDTAGFRMGPFELMDLTGLDVSHPVMESIFGQWYCEPRYRPSYVLRRRLAAGIIGRKVGKGFYEYRDGKAAPPPIAAPVPVSASAPAAIERAAWIWGATPEFADRLRRLVAGSDWPLDENPLPAPDSLCLLAPLGEDTTCCALRLGISAVHAVAVDLLFDRPSHLTVMTTPVTNVDYRDRAHRLLAKHASVTLIRDSTGFVTQRVLAMIVNTAAEIAQQRIASPRDIDTAVALGLGYPFGPLAWGDRLGPKRILLILERILHQTGDPRYRPSLWLTRRARLGVSLLHTDT